MRVTDFPHVKQMFVDAYARLVAMKLFALRACRLHALRLARRPALPAVQPHGEDEGDDCRASEVINLLWDVIAAKGFEKDMYFEMAARDIRALPKLEGTVHVNIALIVKFMPNYFFNPASTPRCRDAMTPPMTTSCSDQGPTKGLGSIRFHDYRRAYDLYDVPNVQVFADQVVAFRELHRRRAAERVAGRRTSTSCWQAASSSRWWCTPS